VRVDRFENVVGQVVGSSSRWRKFRMVVSSGIASAKLRCAKVRNDAISYSASSIAGSLNANQFCIRCTRSIDSSG
jgi:hypothetical protein